MAYIGKTREPSFQFFADLATAELAKSLRKKMTPCEKILWQRLRDHKTGGLKFRRQHPVKRYVADFYCHEARLVVEVDGPIHQHAVHAEHDRQRDGLMEDYGLKVLRFTNNQVRYNIQQVIREIKEVALSRTGHVGSK